jgi:predicted alpha/beta hydrolase family esterase
MKKVIVIHAWDSSPEQHWYREEEKILKEMGYEVIIPVLPGGLWPKLNEWLDVMSGLGIDEDTTLIGHSLGVPAAFRYLEQSNQKVDQVICVAGFAQDLGIAETNNFVDKPFDWKLIKSITNKVVSISQKHDRYVPVEISQEIADKTGGKFVLAEGNNHFDTMDLDLINRELK